ncbi:hypothetical protein BDZ85DRAFT_318313 [Elsinoe ampelina]|uniref:CAP-Gly domain-containing protein n=1 Tax=Elsinoe ampelina TaxID=302913 RepID=A0A6A6GF89_9PEZI|nr:hypothetical protein BDZ85DRAFT_318313 [Elsinoe ampelina]
MASHTPLRRAPARPSMGANSSPNLLERASTNMHRKASYNALIGGPPTTPSSKIATNGGDFAVGDIVNVPGDMFGTVKFIGSVAGKAGRFLGVELESDFAARGKNSGDVDGISYFVTSVPNSGIFLPVHRAQLRYSPSSNDQHSAESSPSTPTAASYRRKGSSPTTPSVPKFAQTVGPGARPPSPSFKPQQPRQSLPRPESPLRRAPNLTPGPPRQFSQSVRPGARPPTTPGRSATPKLSASVRGGAPPTRPYSRTGSRLGQRSESEASDVGMARSSGVPSFSHPMRSPSRLNRSVDEVVELREELSRKERQLEEQAVQLAEMEVSVKELSALIPGSPIKGSSDAGEDGEGEVELRRALKEKNDKISSLVAEFDAHRADFRSTIETLELASDETVRMYEERIRELVAEVQGLRENSTAQKDVESIAAQLKMLEELVAELEDGLEDARRGEAEARGEVEFLRGEVERGRSELKREREKAAQLAGGETDDRGRELEMKDDEIRGLKAILHSVQSNGDHDDDDAPRQNSSVYSVDMEEMKRLQTSLHELEVQNAELEAQLRREQEEKSMLSPSMASKKSFSGMGDSSKEGGSHATSRKPSRVEDEERCDGCNKLGHDLLNCPSFSQPGGYANGTASGNGYLDQRQRNGSLVSSRTGPGVSPLPASEATKTAKDEDKWCALCEQDGHLAFDCPNEQY